MELHVCNCSTLHFFLQTVYINGSRIWISVHIISYSKYCKTRHKKYIITKITNFKMLLYFLTYKWIDRYQYTYIDIYCNRSNLIPYTYQGSTRSFVISLLSEPRQEWFHSFLNEYFIILQTLFIYANWRFNFKIFYA